MFWYTFASSLTRVENALASARKHMVDPVFLEDALPADLKLLEDSIPELYVILALNYSHSVVY